MTHPKIGGAGRLNKLNKMKRMEEWRREEEYKILDRIARDFELLDSEKKLVKYLYAKLRRHGLKKVHPNIKRSDLIILLVYIAIRHSGRRRVIHDHKSRFWFNPNEKALTSITNVLSIILRERPLFRR